MLTESVPVGILGITKKWPEGLSQDAAKRLAGLGFDGQTIERRSTLRPRHGLGTYLEAVASRCVPIAKKKQSGSLNVSCGTGLFDVRHVGGSCMVVVWF